VSGRGTAHAAAVYSNAVSQHWEGSLHCLVGGCVILVVRGRVRIVQGYRARHPSFFGAPHELVVVVGDLKHRHFCPAIIHLFGQRPRCRCASTPVASVIDKHASKIATPLDYEQSTRFSLLALSLSGVVKGNGRSAPAPSCCEHNDDNQRPVVGSPSLPSPNTTRLEIVDQAMNVRRQHFGRDQASNQRRPGVHLFSSCDR
jgi:hypothetical protein